MESARRLRRRLQERQLTLGAFATFQLWPGMVELAIKAGLDYLIVDLEHNAHAAEKVAETCAIGRLLNFPVLIRPPAAEIVAIRLAMDLGPCGLLVPYVESVATMDLIQQGVFMPPRGKRRPGGHGNYWVQQVHYDNWKREVEDDLIILPQIESPTGLAVVDEIAAHPLTTAIAIGPYDMSANLGCCWQPDDPRLQAAVARIRAAGEKAGKPMWHIGDAAKLQAAGFTFICCAELTMLLQGALTKLVTDLRGQSPAPAGQALP